MLFISLTIAYVAATTTTPIELHTDASLSNGRVFVVAPLDSILEDCQLHLNGLESELELEFSWHKYRGFFTINQSGLYELSCNNGTHTGSINILPELMRASRNTVSPYSESKYDGLIPEDWNFLKIYLRQIQDINRFSAFYENGAEHENVTRDEALQYLESLNSTHTHEQIHIEPVYERIVPQDNVSVGGGRGGGDGRRVCENELPPANQTSPLIDGTLGWTKAMNFSAQNRLCGKGATIHFYDDGYHLQHEDLQNPKINVRSQIAKCNTFDKDCDHGTPSLGILAAMKNDFGIEGLSRCADEINLYSYNAPVESVLKYARPGDIYGINVQYCINSCNTMFPFACANPNLVNQFYRNGIIVVQAAGNSHLRLSNYPICQRQSGPSYGFVVSATVRDTEVQRDLGLSDTGIGWFTNYDHANSIVNNWGDKVVTTYATWGDIYFGGQNKGYGTYGGTSSATPLTTGVFGVLQGYMRSRCTNMFLGFDDFAQIFRSTGGAQQVSSLMGYSPNLYRSIAYIEQYFVPRCDKNHLTKSDGYEEYVKSYDDLIDGWKPIASVTTAKCANNNVNISEITTFLNENHLIKWTNAAGKDLILCQNHTNYRERVIYLPPVSKTNMAKLRGTRLTVIRNSYPFFRVAKTFGIGTWDLYSEVPVTFQLNDVQELGPFY